MKNADFPFRLVHVIWSHLERRRTDRVQQGIPTGNEAQPREGGFIRVVVVFEQSIRKRRSKQGNVYLYWQHARRQRGSAGSIARCRLAAPDS
jgi:hypothetical protein